MLHWTPPRTIAPIGAFAPPPIPVTPAADARSTHARMLAHAAKRRLAARGEDAGYWKACAPAALARAAAIRASGALPRLP
jgi:hypothetical protein